METNLTGLNKVSDANFDWQLSFLNVYGQHNKAFVGLQRAFRNKYDYVYPKDSACDPKSIFHGYINPSRIAGFTGAYHTF